MRITTADLKRFNGRLRIGDYSPVRRLANVFLTLTSFNTDPDVAKRFAIDQAIRVLADVRNIVDLERV